MKKYISVDVYRNANLSDSSRMGISSWFNVLYMEHPQGWVTRDMIENEEQIVVLDKILDRLHVRPITLRKGEPMFGGNFVYCSDSRFKEFSGQPIQIHDRVEG